MRASVVLAITCVLLFSGCAQTRVWRSPYHSKMKTIRDPASRSCGSLQRPQAYCGYPEKVYSDASILAESHAKADERCERFYTAAIRVGDILCDYETELYELHGVGQFSDTPYIADRIKQIHIKYQEATEHAAVELDHSFGALGKSNEQQRRTYTNVAWALGKFYERISLIKPRNSRRPASMYPEKTSEKMKENGSVPALMRDMIISMPPVEHKDDTRLFPHTRKRP